jgi:hypothetical protein
MMYRLIVCGVMSGMHLMQVTVQYELDLGAGVTVSHKGVHAPSSIASAASHVGVLFSIMAHCTLTEPVHVQARSRDVSVMQISQLLMHLLSAGTDMVSLSYIGKEQGRMGQLQLCELPGWHCQPARHKHVVSHSQART